MGFALPSRRAASPLRLLAMAIPLALVLVSSGCNEPCNGECPEGTICDTDLLACVPAGGSTSCESDADCTSALAPLCETELKRCVECRVGSDCQTGRCDETTRICLPAGCRRPEDCAGQEGKPYCSSDGSCVECRATPDCPSLDGKRRVCDLGLRICVESICRSDAECARDPSGGRACDVGTGTCVQCTSDAHCDGDRCRLATNRCVKCLSDDDCDPSQGQSCVAPGYTCQVTGCASDDHCPSLSRCDLEARTCRHCLDGSDCFLGGDCDGGSCASKASCDDASDCLWPEVCDEGRCVACITDGDCRDGRTCDDGTCREPEVCTRSTECDPGRRCIGEACADVSCPLDIYEPNDTPGRAYPINPGRVTAVLCPNELDHYVLRVPDGSGLEVTLRHDPVLPSPTLELVALGDEGPQVMVTGSGWTAGSRRAVIETFSSNVEAVLIRVSGAEASTVTYSLDTKVVPGGTCANDEREPDGTPSQATQVAPGVFDGVLCWSEQDWFVVEAEAGLRPVVHLVVNGSPEEEAVTLGIHRVEEGELEQEVLAQLRKVPPVGESWVGVASLASDVVAPEEGARYWIAVKNQTEEKFTYELRIDLRPRPPDNDRCEQPPLLPHNATAQGTLIGASDQGDSGCAPNGSADAFWTLELAEPSAVRLSAVSTVDTAISLRSACDGVELGCASTTVPSDALSFQGLPAGTYVVMIEASGVAQAEYSLLTEVSPAPPPPTGADCTSSEALVFVEGEAQVSGQLALASDSLASCGSAGTDAVYALTLAEARRVEIELDAFDGASLSLVEAERCGEAGECVVVQSGSARLERLALDAGDYRIVVDGGSPRAGAFTLRVKLADPVFPPDNDTCEDAIELVDEASGDTRAATDAFHAGCGSSAGGGRDVVYRFTVTEGEEAIRLSLDASFDATLTVVQAPCESGEVVACADGFDPVLDFAALPAGEYFVWVDAFSEDAGPFTLHLVRAPAEPPPANDRCVDATDVAVSGTVEIAGSTRRATNDSEPAACTGHALSGPDVAYAIEVPAGAILEAELLPDGFDGALYLLDACGATACLIGADDSFLEGGAESLTLTNESGESVTWIVVVDSWHEGAKGTFTLRLTVE